MSTRKRLTQLQTRFVEEYLLDLNATAAVLRAGCKTKNPGDVGSQLLKKPLVAAAISKTQAARAARTGISQDRVLLELEHLAFSNLEDYEVDDNGKVTLAAGAPKHAMRALSSIKRTVSTYTTPGKGTETTRTAEIRLWDKPGPLKLAGRHVGLFADKLELSGPGGRPIQVVDAATLSDAELKAQLTDLLAKL